MLDYEDVGTKVPDRLGCLMGLAAVVASAVLAIWILAQLSPVAACLMASAALVVYPAFDLVGRVRG